MRKIPMQLLSYLEGRVLCCDSVTTQLYHIILYCSVPRVGHSHQDEREKTLSIVCPEEFVLVCLSVYNSQIAWILLV